MRARTSAEDWPCEATFPGPGARPGRQRADGRIRLEVAGATAPHVTRLAEQGALRLRRPRSDGPGLTAVLVNTAGGVACGDRFDIAVEAAGAVTLTTAAAEKIYRSDGPAAETAVRLAARAGASLEWLPQETILFDRARIMRRLDAEVDAGSRLLVFEAVVFGRAARGERVIEGLFEDRWRIRRAGELVYADTLRLAGPLSALLDRPTVAGGAQALATLLYLAPDAEARLAEARAILDGAPYGVQAGASAWRGMLAVRWLASAVEPLRRGAIHFLTAFRGAALPRVWQS